MPPWPIRRSTRYGPICTMLQYRQVTSTVATVHSEALPHARPARCQLVVVEGPDMGRACAIGDGATVGTGEAELVLTDERVSSRHLEVRPDGARFVVRDLGSTNGTFYE